MYRVEWIDDHADFRVKEGFKTSTEAHDWIKNTSWIRSLIVQWYFAIQMRNR